MFGTGVSAWSDLTGRHGSLTGIGVRQSGESSRTTSAVQRRGLGGAPESLMCGLLTFDSQIARVIWDSTSLTRLRLVDQLY